MGCYDNINVPCPKCGADYWAQSKSGECELNYYQLAECPKDVLMDVNRHAPFECECGAVFEVQDGKAVECSMREREDHLGIGRISSEMLVPNENPITPIQAIANMFEKAEYEKETDTYTIHISGDIFRDMTNK